jgi:hypothetical protein
MFAQHGLRKNGNRGGIGDVENVRAYAHRDRAKQFRSTGETFGVDIREREMRTASGEIARQSTPDAAARTGDHRRAPAQVHVRLHERAHRMTPSSRRPKRSDARSRA